MVEQRILVFWMGPGSTEEEVQRAVANRLPGRSRVVSLSVAPLGQQTAFENQLYSGGFIVTVVAEPANSDV